MGYRLDVTDCFTKANMYGTKLYGYCEQDEFDNLLSWKYLVQIGAAKEEDNLYLNTAYFGGVPTDEGIILNPDQFRIFLNLYMIDYAASWKREGETILQMLDLAFGDTWRPVYESNNDKVVGWV